MDIIYELNPPRIINDSNINLNILNREIDKFLTRAQTIVEYTPFIHITDSVLGIPRISSIHASNLIKEKLGKTQLCLSCSIRTRDRNMSSLIQLTTQSILIGIKDILFVFGDKPFYDDNLDDKILMKPTQVVRKLTELGFNKYINLNLSIPNRVESRDKIRKKIEAHPYAVITQSINSLQEIKNLKKIINPNNIKIIPCIMIPSEKNKKSAEIIGIDWSEYEKDLFEFIEEVKKISDKIILTSPNSFTEGTEVLKKINNNHSNTK